MSLNQFLLHDHAQCVRCFSFNQFFSLCCNFRRVINGSNVDMPTPHGPPHSDSDGGSSSNKFKSESNLCIDEINLQKMKKKRTHAETKWIGAVNTRNWKRKKKNEIEKLVARQYESNFRTIRPTFRDLHFDAWMQTNWNLWIHQKIAHEIRNINTQHIQYFIKVLRTDTDTWAFNYATCPSVTGIRNWNSMKIR